MQSGDRGRQEDGREEAAATGGEHRQHPLLTGHTHHVTAKAEGIQSHGADRVLKEAALRKGC